MRARAAIGLTALAIATLVTPRVASAQCAPFIVQDMQMRGIPPFQIMQLCGGAPVGAPMAAPSNMCMTAAGPCQLPGGAPRGAPCGCMTQFGPQQGIVQ